MQTQQKRNPKADLYLLLQAKKMSDQRNYDEKNKILRGLLEKYPNDFVVDSDLNNRFVGITHVPTSFKLHVPRHVIPPSLKRQDPTMKSSDNLSWSDVPEQSVLYADSVKDTFNKVSMALTPGTYAWVSPVDGRVVADKSGYVSTLLEKQAIAHGSAHDERGGDHPWILVKCARDLLLKDIFGPVSQAFMLTPSKFSDMIGGPTPLASSIAGGLLTAGLGYGAGALAENLAPSVFEKGRLRKTLAILGGAAGATPGLLLGGLGASTWDSPLNPDRKESPWNAFITPNVLYGSPKTTHPLPPTPEPPPAPGMMTNIKASSAALAAIQPEISEEMRKAAEMFKHSDFPGLEAAPVDAFNRVILSDPFLPPNYQAAAVGLVTAAGNLRGSSMFVTPMDIARIGLGMGAGYAQAAIGGKVLGALAGLTPGAQKTLQGAGVIAGAVKSVIPGLFGQ